MKNLCTWLCVVPVRLALTGCHADEPARADVPEFSLNEPLTLSGGQDGLIARENLGLRFAEVLEDSRCPTQVECFWTGQARIAVAVQPAGGDSTTVKFNTNPAPGQTAQVADVGQYRIELLSLEPHPQRPDSVPFAAYRATLEVRLK